MRKIDKDKIIINEFGAEQTEINFSFDLIPKEILEMLANIFKYGADKYKPHGWINITINDHINHAIEHIYNFLDDEKNSDNISNKEPELAHAFCRIGFACYLDAIKKGNFKSQIWDKKEKDCIFINEKIRNYINKLKEVKWINFITEE